MNNNVIKGLKKVADVRHDNSVEYYVTDHLGSVSVVTDGSGKETQRYIYGPYGNLEYAKGNSDNRYLTGKEFDSESGNYYFGALYYEVKNGRWQARDPKEEFFSSYVYCGNNPMGFYIVNIVGFHNHWIDDVFVKPKMKKSGIENSIPL